MTNAADLTNLRELAGAWVTDKQTGLEGIARALTPTHIIVETAAGRFVGFRAVA